MFDELGEEANAIYATRTLAFTYERAGDTKRAIALHDVRAVGPPPRVGEDLGGVAGPVGVHPVRDAADLDGHDVRAPRRRGRGLHRGLQALVGERDVLFA